MTIYLVHTRCFLFPDVATALSPPAPAGTPILAIGDRFDGAFNATSNDFIDKTAPEPKGVVEQECLIEVPAHLRAITTEVERTNFCWAASDFAAAEKADRNYLLSVAYYLSTNLGNFGISTDLRYGPFRYSAKEWFAAVTKANAAGRSFRPRDLFDPVAQVEMAAIRTGKAMADFKAAHDRYPIPIELFFYERLGEDALALLRLTPQETCIAALSAATAATPYGTEIKDRKSGDVIKEVKDGLTAGFVASRPDVERLQPHRRFFSDEDMAPWLTVARLMTAEDLSIKPTTLAGTFMTFPPALGANDRRSAAFVAFSLIESGVTEAKASVPGNNTAGLPETWKTWSKEAGTTLRPGAIVVTKPQADGKPSVGILAEKPAGDSHKVYFCSDAGTISVGVKTIDKATIDKLRWLDITGADDTADPTLGSLSQKYESGRNGPATVSTGKGDAGGVSYGTYQFSSTRGSAKEFVASLPDTLKARFGAAAPGSADFNAIWIAVASEDPAGFGKLQHDYVKAQYYDKLATAVKTGAGFDVNTRSSALKNCFWSTAVQHGVGGATPIVRNIISAMQAAASPPLDPIKPFDKVALEKIYAERGSGPVGAMTHFGGNSAEVQAGVAARFRSELADALKMLEGE